VTLQRVLTEGALWGPHCRAVLANIASWRDAGESTIAVFNDRVLGSTAFPDTARALPAVARLRDAMAKPKPPLRREFAALLDAAAKGPPPFDATAVLVAEDRLVHVAWTGPQLRFLAERLTVAAVEARLGRPESVTRETVQTDRDYRPAVLIKRSYAAGAVVFVETDQAPRPGFVDRVLLDTKKAVAAIFLENGQ